jgi:hypothetical protein
VRLAKAVGCGIGYALLVSLHSFRQGISVYLARAFGYRFVLRIPRSGANFLLAGLYSQKKHLRTSATCCNRPGADAEGQQNFKHSKMI